MAELGQIGWTGLFDSIERGRTGGAIDWATYARAYDFLPKVFREYRENMRIVDDALTKRVTQDSPRICDLGAGTGVYVEHLANLHKNWKFTHVDSNGGMSRIARAKYRILDSNQVSVIDDSAQFVLFPEHSFDAIICVNALYAMPPQGRVIQKMYDWLKPGGVLVCIDFGRMQRPLDWLSEFMRLVIAREIDFSTTLETLGVASNLLRQAVKGSGGQSTGQYWMHELQDFVAAFGAKGFEIEESFVCYRGYCDGVIARRPSA